MQVTGAEILAEREEDGRFGFHRDGLRLTGEFDGVVLDVNAAEERDAVHAKALQDGIAIGRAVGQVVVIVIRLEHVQQNFHECFPLVAVLGLGLKAGIGRDEQGHGGVPIAPHQQVRVIPRATDDFAVGVHLAHQILRIHLRILVVPADEEGLVFHVASGPEDGVAGQADGPEVRVALIDAPVGEGSALALVEQVVDAVTVFVEHDVADQREGIAPIPFAVEVDAGRSRRVEGVAGPVDIHEGGQREVQTVEVGQPGRHVVVDAVDIVVGAQLPDVGRVVQADDRVAGHLHIEGGGDLVGGHRAPQALELKAEFLGLFGVEQDHSAFGCGHGALHGLDLKVSEPNLHGRREWLGQVNRAGQLAIDHLHQGRRPHGLDAGMGWLFGVSHVLHLVLAKPYSAILEVDEGPVVDWYALVADSPDFDFPDGPVVELNPFTPHRGRQEPLPLQVDRHIGQGQPLSCCRQERVSVQFVTQGGPGGARVALGSPRNHPVCSGFDHEFRAEHRATFHLLMRTVQNVLSHGDGVPFSRLRTPAGRQQLGFQPLGGILHGKSWTVGPVHGAR